MSLNREAIEKIQESTAISQIAKNLNESLRSGTPIAYVPDNFKMSNLTAYLPTKQRFTGQFATNVIDDFARYVNASDSTDAKCFVDVDEMNATAIMDLGDPKKPLHGDHVAFITLAPTPEFRQIDSVAGDKMDQKLFAEWCEDYSDHINFINSDGEELNTAGAVSAIRSVTVDEMRSMSSDVGDHHSERTALEKTSIKDAKKLPKYIQFTCTPFVGIEERTFLCRVSAITRSEPIFTLHPIKYQEAMKDIGDEFYRRLNSSLSEVGCSMPVLKGRFNI